MPNLVCLLALFLLQDPSGLELGVPFRGRVATSGSDKAGPEHVEVVGTPVLDAGQTPDPTVQLVRRVCLEEIRAQDPPHYTDIFDLDLRKLDESEAPREVAASVVAHNERMIEREGRAELQAILDDIREDRARTYAKLLPLL